MTTTCGPKSNKKVQFIDFANNASLCLNFGFGTLLTASRIVDYRNAVVAIHNGCELFMKQCLKSKDKLLIFKKISFNLYVEERKDLIKKIKTEKIERETISFRECQKRLEIFSDIPNRDSAYLSTLNWIRNEVVHSEYSFEKKELRILLISHIFRFIKDLSIDMSLNLFDFIEEKNIQSLESFKKSIDNKIETDYYKAIEVAKKHYFKELNEDERKQKKKLEEYPRSRHDKIVICPACQNNALLKMHIVVERDYKEFHIEVIQTSKLISLSCLHCGLHIKNSDQLRIIFGKEEKTNVIKLSHQRFSTDWPDDCPDDCYDDCPDDCPDDCYDDCPDDCPDDCNNDRS